MPEEMGFPVMVTAAPNWSYVAGCLPLEDPPIFKHLMASNFCTTDEKQRKIWIRTRLIYNSAPTTVLRYIFFREASQ